MVKLGITTAVVFVPRYRGNTTATSWPCATRAFGSASTTSARPPVFENGSPSDATNRILTACSLSAHRKQPLHFTLPERRRRVRSWPSPLALSPEGLALPAPSEAEGSGVEGSGLGTLTPNQAGRIGGASGDPRRTGN